MSGQLRDRSELLRPVSYDVFLDITHGDQTFVSRAEIYFTCSEQGAVSFADLHAVGIHRATLNGEVIDIPAHWRGGRLELRPTRGQNVLTVEAEFAYATAVAAGKDELEGQGLYRVDGADDSGCVYSKAYRGGASRMYCCFDVPQLRAPITFSVRAPAGWSCLSNAPAVSPRSSSITGLWRFAPTPGIPPAISSICAGAYAGESTNCKSDIGPALPVRVLSRLPASEKIRPRRLLSYLSKPLRYYESNLGVPFPYAKCDILIVPGFPGLAFSAPGLIAMKEEALIAACADDLELYVAAVIGHELSHAWIGGLASIIGGQQIEMWLVEALATYISRTALAETMPGAEPWAPVVDATLPDHSYAANAAIIRQLESLIGRGAVFRGLGSFLRQHRNADGSQKDLVRCWADQSDHDLAQWASANLRPAAQI
jgi:aminopeptidase N